jgi:hypothetical protein
MYYEPQGTMWPDPAARPKPAPSPGPDPLPPGVFPEADVATTRNPIAERVTDAAIPSSPLDFGMMLATGGGSIPLRMGALAAGAALDSDEAEAGKAKAIAKTLEEVAGVAKSAKQAGRTMGDILGLERAPDIKTGTAEERIAPAIIKRDTSIADPYINNAQRVAYPGIYGDPREIAANAAAQVAPEHPALKQLFGVTRQDLYDIGEQGRRQGNITTPLTFSAKPRPNEAAQGIMTPANAQRLIDANAEALKHPELVRGMDAWYVMDPMYQRMVQLVGPERAKAEYQAFNSTVPPFSAASDVMTEINRGTGANMYRVQGRFPEYLQYGGKPVADRPPTMGDLAEMKGHAYHSTAQAPPVDRYIRTGQHGYDKDTVKVPLYKDALGVPETGFQTGQPVPDAHFTRASGMSDTRTTTDFGKFMGGTEYREAGPWFAEHVAKPLGIEAVPAQARTWGVFSPITGVDTPIGAPKLELHAIRMWERAKQLGIDPETLRDQVLTGQQHSSLDDDSMSRYG